MPVHRVVTQVGGATDEPIGKRRIAVVANLLWLSFPINELGLLSPERVTIFE
jgi:hypothetical protein